MVLDMPTYNILYLYDNNSKSDTIVIGGNNALDAIAHLETLCSIQGKGVIDVVSIKEMPPVFVSDSINHPQHYNMGKFEVIDVIEDWQLNFNLGNSVKYIARAEHKGNRLEDLKKAKWYLEREIGKVEKI